MTVIRTGTGTGRALTLDEARRLDTAKARSDAEGVREEFIKSTERTWQNPDPKGARPTTDDAGASGALLGSGDKALCDELAQLVPGIAVEGRPTGYLVAALKIARDEPSLRGRPSDVQSRAEFHLQSESAYLAGDPGGQTRR